MAEYIGRETALDALKNAAEYYSHVDDCTEHSIRKCMSTIQKIPAADVVEVVRCRECKHYKEFRTKRNKQIMRLCYRMGKYDMEYHVKPDNFCSYGERRNDDAGSKID